MTEEKLYCKGGGCTAKLGPNALERVLSLLPEQKKDPNLLVGFQSSDDAAVYQVSENLAVVQTVDFFPPMIEDPYLFGQVAAANALSDIYAMGGKVATALNLVCFPEKEDLNVLGKILEGGLSKVQEAGGTLVGGHSIQDNDVKYGLSVNGLIDPRHVYRNDTAAPGDALVLTKRLGVGILCTANRVGEAGERGIRDAIRSMTRLNKESSELSKKYKVHACTDVTGFGFLGHLLEMLGKRHSATVYTELLPVFPEALKLADALMITAAAQRNRNHVGNRVVFQDIPFAMEEILFDPQTSGGLLFAMDAADAVEFSDELKKLGHPAEVVGTIAERSDRVITVL